VAAVRRTRTRDGLRVTNVRLDARAFDERLRRLLSASAQRTVDGALHLVGDLPVVAATAYEARIVAAELESGNGYLNGTVLPAAPTVVDIGAHIGLFTLQVLRHRPDARVVAVEPFGASFRLLRRNLRLHGGRVSAVRAAAGSRPGRGLIHGSRGAALLASTTPGEDHEVVAATWKSLRHRLPGLLRRGTWGEPTARSAADDVLSSLFAPTSEQVPQVTVSDLVRRHGLRRVSLLKIDVEGAEAAVLDGVDPEHWPLIDLVVLEAEAALAAGVCDRLRAHGLEPVVTPMPFVGTPFARRCVLVRAGGRATTAGTATVPRAPDPWRDAVRTYRALADWAAARAGGPAPDVLLDLFADRRAGPLALPWPHRPLSHLLHRGQSWAGHFLRAYGGTVTGDGATVAECLFGGHWSLPGTLGTVDLAAAVAARLAGVQVLDRIVGTARDGGHTGE
jgi:FkbM family methyltransferase